MTVVETIKNYFSKVCQGLSYLIYPSPEREEFDIPYTLLEDDKENRNFLSIYDLHLNKHEHPSSPQEVHPHHLDESNEDFLNQSQNRILQINGQSHQPNSNYNHLDPTNELCQHQDTCVREFYLPDLDTENPHHHRDVLKCEPPHPINPKYPDHKCDKMSSSQMRFQNVRTGH